MSGRYPTLPFSVLGTVAGWEYFHELWVELAEDFDQISLHGRARVAPSISTSN